ncbi:hypothetical protein NHX12_023284 [Muraenolepis orangiensis]|uniref:Large ribosomal subunit protein mL53 n=1 Tax=Muraenolepis orangiensis TaxID=630683 RepID=A0A9Q0IS02_9TELE|nr:hypothetical protein NHX12_023284 [Muraenolepis orangiensis]
MAASTKSSVVLKAVKQVVVQWCPFEPNVRSTRDFLFMVGSEKARATNMNCEVKAIVLEDLDNGLLSSCGDSDRPADGERLVMKGTFLTGREMLQAFQTRCIAKELQPKAMK